MLLNRVPVPGTMNQTTVFFCRALKSGNNKTNPTEKQEHYKNNNKNRPMAKRIVHIKPSITFYDSGHDYRKAERDGDKE